MRRSKVKAMRPFSKFSAIVKTDDRDFTILYDRTTNTLGGTFTLEEAEYRGQVIETQNFKDFKQALEALLNSI